MSPVAIAKIVKVLRWAFPAILLAGLLIGLKLYGCAERADERDKIEVKTTKAENAALKQDFQTQERINEIGNAVPTGTAVARRMRDDSF